MLDKLLSFIHPQFGLDHFVSLISSISGVAAHLNQDYLKDKNSKNAAIDTIIEILQTYKDI